MDNNHNNYITQFQIMARCAEDEKHPGECTSSEFSGNETGPEDFVPMDRLEEEEKMRKYGVRGKTHVGGAEAFGEGEKQNSSDEEDWDNLPLDAPVKIILDGIGDLMHALDIAQNGLNRMKTGFMMVQKI